LRPPYCAATWSRHRLGCLRYASGRGTNYCRSGDPRQVSLGGWPTRSDLHSWFADPRVTQDNINTTICVSGYTRQGQAFVDIHRLLSSDRSRNMATSIPTWRTMRRPHLIPLELGGHPTDPRNLWPELRQVHTRQPQKMAWRTRSIPRCARDR